ncbi:MAG: nicotinate (nicotinamide) nucleotide adenylyltransferase [Alphaproteobacteria bacterium]|nr:nicotinate (nicotinamide) nucleotide adenylyltransferase [Alphaproteobacteria bacterium]
MTSRRHPRPRVPHRLPGPTEGLAIGLLGGSFDPPHAGHAHLIDTARRRLGLDYIWIVPAAGNPLKRTATSFGDRLDAARRKLSERRTLVSSIESDLGSIYTIDTLRHLKRLAPRARFVWLIGADNLDQFHRWRRWAEIARLIPMAVVARPGASPKAGLSPFARRFSAHRLPTGAGAALPDAPTPAWIYLTAPFDSHSSSEIRAGHKKTRT